MRPAMLLLIACLVLETAAAREFTVLVYNVENLTGPNGKTVSMDYSPARYSRTHLLTKLKNIASLVSQFDEGRGPDIILFQELERDFGADQYLFDHQGMLKHFAGTRIENMLGRQFTPEIASLPVEALLLKAFEDHGMKGYHVVAADDAPRPDHRRYVTHINVVYTRFPVGAVHSYPVANGPAILEVQVDIGNYPLYLFNNHWKGEPADQKAERYRVDAARLVRDRLDEIFEAVPHADVLVAGCFNSFYDQKQRFGWRRTAVNDILRGQHDELHLRGQNTDLYNLWYELPLAQRGSELYRNGWGTFMQMMLSKGLYDFQGVQYVDNSFGVACFEGMNMLPNGEPFRWTFAGVGNGYSEHFPLFARFRTVRTNRPQQFLQLSRPAGTMTARN